MGGIFIRATAKQEGAAWREEEARRNARLLKDADFRAFLESLAFKSGFFRAGGIDCARPYETGRRAALTEVVSRFVRADGGLDWLAGFLKKLEKKEKEAKEAENGRIG